MSPTMRALAVRRELAAQGAARTAEREVAKLRRALGARTTVEAVQLLLTRSGSRHPFDVALGGVTPPGAAMIGVTTRRRRQAT